MVFTFDGYGLPIAWQLQKEGHDVLVAQVTDKNDTVSDHEKGLDAESEEEKARRLSMYDGILDKCPADKVVSQLEHARNPGEFFLFFDLNHLFKFSERLAAGGFMGNFPAEADYLFEIERSRAKEFVASNYRALNVGHHESFADIGEARRFLSKSEELWVLKGLRESARTVVPDVDDRDLAHEQILDALQRSPEEYESEGFILELLVKDALELTPGKIYYDGKPVATFMCLENKALGAGNVGPMTDCAQDLIFETELTDKINRIAFPAVVDEMARVRKGMFLWDASLYVDPKSGKIYFGEFCPNRPGYNSLYTELTLASSASSYFESIVAGRSPYSANQVAASVRLFNLHRDRTGRPFPGASLDYKDRIDKVLWLYDVRKDRNRLVSCGYQDTIGVLTGKGHSISEAAKHAYHGIAQFSFEGAYYRPEFDFNTREYNTSILNRLDYGLRHRFYKAGFSF